MSSPNEPGNGNAAPPGRRADSGSAPLPTPEAVTDRTDVPPWERGATGPTQTPSSRRRAENTSGPPRSVPDIEERINRFISGPAATPATPPAPEVDAPAPAAAFDAPPPAPARAEAAPAPAPARTEAPATTREAVRSELPDLSGPTPRPPRPKPAPRSDSEVSRRVQVGARTSGPVRASMQIRRVDPWSVLKVSLVLSVALFFVWMIAVAFLYLVLGGMGVWAKLNSNVGDLLNNTSNSELVSSGTIFGSAALIGLVNIVLLTAMATVGAFIYNLTTDLVGGVEVTLADRD